MIKNKVLKGLLDSVPDDAMIFAYEGEYVGLVINYADGSQGLIKASECSGEEIQDDIIFEGGVYEL